MIQLTPDTRPKEKIKMFSGTNRLIIKQVGKEDTYYQYDLAGIEGNAYVDDMYRVVFVCDTDLEAFGLKASMKKIIFTDVIFEEVK